MQASVYLFRNTWPEEESNDSYCFQEAPANIGNSLNQQSCDYLDHFNDPAERSPSPESLFDFEGPVAHHHAEIT
jgi:hypothetical protein